jgi:hypothetical protein
MRTYTADQLALHAHIVAQNEAFVAQCKAEGSTFWMHPSDDLDMWIDMGINTIAEYELSQAISYFSDYYKEVVGIRPRHYDFSEMTLADVQKEIGYLDARVKMNEERLAASKAAEAAAHAERKRLNAYRPNLALSGLRELLCAK